MQLVICIVSVLISINVYGQGGSGGSGVPDIVLNRLQGSYIVHQYNDLMRAYELEKLGAKYKMESPLGKNFVPVGEVIDFKIKGREEELDLQAVLDENHEWLKAFNGEYWIRKDAPVENYQNANGEIIELD